MECPTCQQTLLMTDRQGVEIDYCPKCRGVWLDRGELEKLIERSLPSPETGTYQGDRRRNDDDHDDDDYRDRSDKAHYDGKYKKRESWFSRIFDLD